jgi:hypothetical protein
MQSGGSVLLKNGAATADVLKIAQAATAGPWP